MGSYFLTSSSQRVRGKRINILHHLTSISSAFQLFIQAQKPSYMDINNLDSHNPLNRNKNDELSECSKQISVVGKGKQGKRRSSFPPLKLSRVLHGATCHCSMPMFVQLVTFRNAFSMDMHDPHLVIRWHTAWFSTKSSTRQGLTDEWQKDLTIRLMNHVNPVWYDKAKLTTKQFISFSKIKITISKPGHNLFSLLGNE